MSAARTERRDLLVEVGTEELPPKALHSLGEAFAAGLIERLSAAGLVMGAHEWFATPRRLAVLVRRLAAQAPDQLVRRRGPPVSVAFDAAGAPTRPGLSFAASCGVEPVSLGRERDARGVEYLSYEGTRAGAPAVALLPAMVQEALDALPVPKRMRWGSLAAQFVRPVHWLVLLYGRDVVPATLLGVNAGQQTRGHRFMAPRPLQLTAPSSYARTLLNRGRVIPNFGARREQIRMQIASVAEQLGGRALVDPALLDEVTALVEWPVALAGSFEARFLALPREVLLATLQAHQRYFAIQGEDGALLAQFITISNIDSPEPQLIRAGNERVVRARLADAAFFYQQDRREPLAAWQTQLARVTFHAQLGSLAARSERITALALATAESIGAEPTAVERAARLAKCDLLSAMVGEFPELQGIMGRYYALADGEAPAVAEAIAEQYLPRMAGDALPASRVGDALALADKLDLIAGLFVAGDRPSGTRDPFGVRRAAIGLLRIQLEHRLELDLPTLIDTAVRLQPVVNGRAPAVEVANDIYAYLMERLRGHYLERSADLAVTTEMFDAVLAVRPRSLLDGDARLRALITFLSRPEGVSLAAAHKRTANILRKSAPPAGGPTSARDLQPIVEVELLAEPAERALYEALERLDGSVTLATQARDYDRALTELAGLRPAVDAFFDQVLVNDPNSRLRDNRLALLARLRALFAGVAELSCLPG